MDEPEPQVTFISLQPQLRKRFRRGLVKSGFRMAPRLAQPGKQDMPLAGVGDDECWRGEIEVTWEDPQSGLKRTAVHLIELVLPAGFPFEKPTVFCVDEEPALQGNRHQAPGPGGALCLWNEDLGPHRGWSQSMEPAELLERVREWFVK